MAEEKKLRLVIADEDMSSVNRLEEMIIRRFSRLAEIWFFTDQSCLEDFMQETDSVDVLAISETMYGDFLENKKIGQVFLVIPEIEVGTEYPEDVTVVMKFMPSEEFVSRIEAALQERKPEEKQEQKPEKKTAVDVTGVLIPGERDTKVIAVYSPIGGCGKSLTTLALAKKLKRLDQQVLVIGCDPMQSISVFLPQGQYADEKLAEDLKNPGEDTYWQILQSIRQDDISYLLPFEKTLPMLGIGAAEWKALVEILKEKKDFDYLIMDVGCTLSTDAAALLGEADKLIFITEPGETANLKVQKLLKNAELLPQCECIMIANGYRGDGQHIASDRIFGEIAPCASWKKALEDPLFYRVVLEIVE